MSGGDLPGLKALMARMNSANRSVLVGVPAGVEHTAFKADVTFDNGKKAKVTVKHDAGGGTSMATIAAVHEFGSPEQGIPERSFLRGGIRRAAPKLNAVNIDSLRKVLLGKMTIEQALEKLGVVAVGEVKREFVVGSFVPLKPETIKRKGSTRPLIDTGNLRQAVTYVVEGASNAR
jgi:hypothetical protein